MIAIWVLSLQCMQIIIRTLVNLIICYHYIHIMVITSYEVASIHPVYANLLRTNITIEIMITVTSHGHIANKNPNVCSSYKSFLVL